MQAWLYLTVAAAAALLAPARAQVTVPLYKNEGDGFSSDGYGVYISINMGGQDIYVILDTGSSTLALPTASTTCEGGSTSSCPLPVCSDSESCTTAVYSPSASSTMLPVAPSSSSPDYCNTPVTLQGTQYCGFAISYGVTSTAGISGYLAWDSLVIGGQPAVTVPFGVIDQLPQDFQRPPAAGIFGVSYVRGNCLAGTLSQTSDAVTCEIPALDAFLRSNGLANSFAMCMGSPGNNGAITFGGTESQYYTGSFQYTPITKFLADDSNIAYDDQWYNVNLTAVGVNGNQFSLDPSIFDKNYGGTFNGGTMIDSGTPVFFLVQPAYDAYAESETSCSSDAQCNIDLWFVGGAHISVPNLATCSSGVCQLTQYVQPQSSRTVIGYAVMRSFYVNFDRSSPAQIGFATASSQCAP